MKRRTFGTLAAGNMLALGMHRVNAESVSNVQLLNTKLTPFGGERAGNLDGSIPEWTGGYAPGSAVWKGSDQLPDYIFNDRPLFSIESGNIQQHAPQLAPGVIALIQNFGYSIQVYPSRRSHALPQKLYDNIARNAETAALNPVRGAYGFTGGYGGIPFPVIDTTDPYRGGAQLIWNYLSAYEAFSKTEYIETNVVSGGIMALASSGLVLTRTPYYDPAGSLETFDGWRFKNLVKVSGPAIDIGQEYLNWQSNTPAKIQDKTWILLLGEGRVREAPDIQFDTPSSLVDGMYNADETIGFLGSPIEYDWKLLGKKELYIPYNNNGILQHTASEVITSKFVDPDFLRWELHRVWVVEARLHDGYRNVLPRRVFYFDEDTFHASIVDVFDADDNHIRTSALFNMIEAQIIGTTVAGQQVFNLQSGDFVVANVNFHKSPDYIPTSYDVLSESTFDPTAIAASAAY